VPASASAPRRAPASSRATSPLSSRLPRPADAQFASSALDSDACSKKRLFEAWSGNDAFASMYPSWENGVCPCGAKATCAECAAVACDDAKYLDGSFCPSSNADLKTLIAGLTTEQIGCCVDTSEVTDFSHLYDGTANAGLDAFGESDPICWNTAKATTFRGMVRVSIAPARLLPPQLIRLSVCAARRSSRSRTSAQLRPTSTASSRGGTRAG